MKRLLLFTILCGASAVAQMISAPNISSASCGSASTCVVTLNATIGTGDTVDILASAVNATPITTVSGIGTVVDDFMRAGLVFDKYLFGAHTFSATSTATSITVTFTGATGGVNVFVFDYAVSGGTPMAVPHSGLSVNSGVSSPFSAQPLTLGCSPCAVDEIAAASANVTAVSSPWSTHAAFLTTQTGAGAASQIATTITAPSWTAAGASYQMTGAFAFGFAAPRLSQFAIQDFSTGTNGSAPTTALLQTSTFGATGGAASSISGGNEQRWTWNLTNVGSALTYATSAHMFLPRLTPKLAEGGAVYSDTSTVGLHYDTTAGSGNLDYLDYFFPYQAYQTGVGTTTLSTIRMRTSLQPADSFNMDPFSIYGTGSGGTVGFAGVNLQTNGTNVYLALEASGSTIPISTNTALANAQQYDVALMLQSNVAFGGSPGTCTMAIYPVDSNGNSSPTNQLGSTLQVGCGNGPAIKTSFGDLLANAKTSGRGVDYDKLRTCYLGCTAADFPLLGQPLLSDGILSAQRSIDWTKDGVPGGIPSSGWPQCVTTACLAVTSAGTGATCAQINAALASAGGSNTYVLIAFSAYSFSSCQIVYPTSGHVTLRSTPPSSGTETSMTFGGTNVGCGRSGTAGICGIDAANANITAPSTTTAWTAGYNQGATATTLTSVTGILDTTNALPTLLSYSGCDTGLITGFGCTGGTNADNGQLFVSDQIYSTGSSTGCCGNGAGNIITNRGQAELHVASSVVGSVVNLSIPLSMPNYASAAVPSVGQTQSIAYIGLENIIVKDPTSAMSVGISFQNCYACWITNSGVTDANSHITWGINCLGCVNSQITGNYVFGISGNANPYGIRCMMCSYNRIDNNIIQQVGTPFSFDGSSMGDVIAYNYVPNATFNPTSNVLQSAFNSHAFNAMDLYEGNVATQEDNDGIHGTAFSQANFRNIYTGWFSQPSNPITAFTNARNDASFDRYMSDVAGLYGSSIYHTTYINTNCSSPNTAVYLLGTNCPYASSPGVPLDSLVKTTSLRYGVYDTVTGAIRWCGSALNTGWSGTCGSASEAPTGASTYPNAAPLIGDTLGGQPALPASFGYSAKPSFWDLSPWPGIGPDASGGLVTCTGTINTGGQFAGSLTNANSHCTGTTGTTAYAGHGNPNPAMTCAISLGMPPDGSGSELAFNPNCGGSPPVVTPTFIIIGKNHHEKNPFIPAVHRVF